MIFLKLASIMWIWSHENKQDSWIKFSIWSAISLMHGARISQECIFISGC